jgi:crotonobetainyl-CoA:carnitine CoA-transferase CaiB-like acyl-CoA transferase
MGCSSDGKLAGRQFANSAITPMSDATKPFSGLKVFDATQGVAGPHCALLLAQHGADVIKVEPLDGDWGRTLGKLYGEHCAHSVAFNRGKRSIALDLKNAEGLAVARKLASEADIVLESFRPGVMARFGLDYESVAKQRPEVVYLSVSGFGQEGPYNKLPVTDSVIQAFSGLMSINRDEQGSPQRIGMIAIDVMTGLYAYQAVASAMLARFRFGQGRYIDCSLMQSAAAFQTAKIMEHHLEGGAPMVLYMPIGTMKTSDGYINITAMREKHYVSLCKVLGLEELIDDPRFDNRDKRVERADELMPFIRAKFVHKTTAEWAELLTEAEVMNAPVATYTDYMADEHVKATRSLEWVEHGGIGQIPLANIPGVDPIEAGSALSASPVIGEHSRAILEEAGYDSASVESLLAAGAVAAATD